MAHDDPTPPNGITPDGHVHWNGPPNHADLGIDLHTVPLTKHEQHVTFRALNVSALLVEMGADWIGLDNPDEIRRLARVVLPGGIGIDLEAGE